MKFQQNYKQLEETPGDKSFYRAYKHAHTHYSLTPPPPHPQAQLHIPLPLAHCFTIIYIVHTKVYEFLIIITYHLYWLQFFIPTNQLLSLFCLGDNEVLQRCLRNRAQFGGAF